MDGVNGITFLNALVTFLTLIILNIYYVSFTSNVLLTLLVLASIVFGFFNFRKKAICFAGDIGSITLGFTIIYFILKLYFSSKNPLVFGLLAVYLIDGGWTIIERRIRKENIFEAHKRHLYQILANKLKTPHLLIAIGYLSIQILINIFVLLLIFFPLMNNWILIVLLFLVNSVGYIIYKRSIIKKIRNE